MRPERGGGVSAPAGRIAGIVLAAGASTRMGRNKLLLPLGAETVLRRAARRAAEAGLDPVVVVLGHEAERARAELEGLSCRVVDNPDHARGMVTSIRAGLAALPGDAVAAVVSLADMPLVTAPMISALVERYRRGEAPLVVSEYDGTLAPPMLYDRRYFAELLDLSSPPPPRAERGREGSRESGGDEGGCGKRVVKRHRGEAVAVPWPASALADLDVPADYERVLAGEGSEP
jgi:molybdenum cofactor cytidylyltransferase